MCYPSKNTRHYRLDYQRSELSFGMSSIILVFIYIYSEARCSPKDVYDK